MPSLIVYLIYCLIPLFFSPFLTSKHILKQYLNSYLKKTSKLLNFNTKLKLLHLVSSLVVLANNSKFKKNFRTLPYTYDYSN